MKFPFVLAFILATQLAVGCSLIRPTDSVENVFPQAKISSYILLDTKAINEKLAKKPVIENSPLLTVLGLLNIGSDQKELAIYQSFPSIEDKKNVIITVIRSGYLDDSVRGEWNQVELKSATNHKWIVEKAKRAFSCWRSGSDSYQKEPCP